ncbi:MAG TPA: hypothetical protein VE623_08845 [Acidimicrobiales bacterium]|jgi:hypothetical protein|nr:hypothetical protein [Acidimicrobiales bacterium]
MEWLVGLALLPALMCAVMMGGTVLAGVIGWRRAQAAARTERAETPEDARTPADARW